MALIVLQGQHKVPELAQPTLLIFTRTRKRPSAVQVGVMEFTFRSGSGGYN